MQKMFPSIHDVPSKRVSVIVPAYNEAKRLPKMLTETIGYFTSRKLRDKQFDWEVIIVDDGCKDNTFEVAFEYVIKHGSDHVRILKSARNNGKGGAVRKGMLKSRLVKC